MDRPVVLIVESESSRRRELGRRLAELGYEVVPAVDVDEGLRFAEGLGPSVTVADAKLPELGDAETLERLARTNRYGTLVLLGAPQGPEEELPQEVICLPTGREITDTLMSKLRLVLLGREVGVEPDVHLEALVGDLALTPPLEVIRKLGRAAFSGRIVLEEGEILFHRGDVIAAAAGRVRGIKAFCRLGRQIDGPYRVRPGRLETEAEPREIDEQLDSLVIRAVEDASAGEFPRPRMRLSVEMGPAFFSAGFSRRQQEMITAAHRGTTVGHLFDTLPYSDGEVLQDLVALQEQGVIVLEEPEAGTTVVTDSTCDLPREVCRRLGIEVVPLSVHFGERRYTDGVDLTPRQFYDLLECDASHPSTEPPSEEDFGSLYRSLLARRDVVSLHISSLLSETFAHAREAAGKSLEGHPARPGDGQPAAVAVLDTRQVSLGLGMLAVFAARLARRGKSAAEVHRICESIAGRFHVLFVVNTLEYLARGGRIGRAQAWMGQLLRIKPILGVENGEVVPVDRIRGGRGAHPRILELLHRRLDPGRPLLAGIAHAKAPVWADRLAELIARDFDVREMLRSEMGPVVGTHAGPGTVGVVAFQPEEDELELLAPLGEG